MKTTEKFSYKAFTKMVIPRMIITSEDRYPAWLKNLSAEDQAKQGKSMVSKTLEKYTKLVDN